MKTVEIDKDILNKALEAALKRAGLDGDLSVRTETAIWVGLCEFFGIDLESQR